MEKLLYFECAEGISGDMAVSSLLHLGADFTGLMKTLDSLKLAGYRAELEKFGNRGISTYRFNVLLDDERHPDDAGGARDLADVFAVLSRLSDPRVRTLSEDIFRIVAEAEAQVHGKHIHDVHFHEVGAVDSIVDIVSFAFCYTDLGFTDTVLSSVTEGTGTVRCAHGVLPVPVPAVCAITERYSLPLRVSSLAGERITPTGAAILAAVWHGAALPETYTVCGCGYGSGHRCAPDPSMLRAMEIRPLYTENGSHPMNDAGEDTIIKLECNVDDCSGEALGYVMEKLLSGGARDVFFTPVTMKKNRPGTMISVLCTPDLRPAMERILFTHTTTIGIRHETMFRTVLPRRIETADTPYGPVRAKIVTYGSEEYAYPEYESVHAIAEKNGLPYRKAYDLIRTYFS
ncbi:MAG: nickel pincer cofactor biosynthesis protein LarC [Lachnospiraceae bacterium]|nr:nickel pincer cofactor biosynthesis protein LarC [Lachnospiraceae bacterium]